jgi:hypothetical protein
MYLSTPRRRTPRAVTTVAILAVVLPACAREQAEQAGPAEQVVQGECRAVHRADVCAWDRMAGDSLVAFGLTVPMQVVDSAPMDAPMVWPPVAAATIPLSPAARAAGFDNVTIFWENHGHPPAPYLVPHFDFHWNTVTSADLGAIDCADQTRPAHVPAAYELTDIDIPGLGTLVGLCVPQMGMHALASADLAAGTPFEQTMIVGYYAGRPIFVEPMITQGTLLSRRNFPLTVPAVPDGQPGVRYPTHFVAEYDSTAHAYRFAFSGLGAGGTP